VTAATAATATLARETAMRIVNLRPLYAPRNHHQQWRNSQSGVLATLVSATRSGLRRQPPEGRCTGGEPPGIRRRSGRPGPQGVPSVGFSPSASSSH
jgi:hypothetical protein